jgi:hypothetical protein
MKLKKVRLFFLPLIVLLVTSQLRADVTVNWNADSLSAVDVIISGSGIASYNGFGTAAGFSDTITSPSGLWQLSSMNICVNAGPSGGWGGYSPDQILVNIYQNGSFDFLGQLADPSSFLCTTPGTYSDIFPATAPVSDGTMLLGTWSGDTRFTVPSLPDLNDPSTWSWTIEYQASGQTLDVVPEPGTACLVLFGASIFALRKLSGANSKNQTLPKF